VVGLGDVPVALPEAVIAEIRDRVRRAQQEDPLGLGRGAYLNPGDRVRIASGALAGYEGMFDLRLGGQTRARILVEFMGRELAAEVDVRSLEKIERRRTQGTTQPVRKVRT
jgi:transcription antitermination factor NusG